MAYEELIPLAAYGKLAAQTFEPEYALPAAFKKFNSGKLVFAVTPEISVDPVLQGGSKTHSLYFASNFLRRFRVWQK